MTAVWVLSVWLLYDPDVPPVTWEVPSLEECRSQADLWTEAAVQWRERTERGGQQMTTFSVARCDPKGQTT